MSKHSKSKRNPVKSRDAAQPGTEKERTTISKVGREFGNRKEH
ncbi:hypothetical protein SAMN05421736_101762 [Evansella caseinilytica]|uniref:Uncharacterized protein n=1 Tax=Evansella caseinilytica TaxID=1503961 RepID=A0A1H3IAJ8_9BACI|nr:hypothetical protein [Evansella caseinilytica]SDY24532.1 hypothetical protein SAMN05421736_101762 [Evansella caseinilytica]